MKKVRLLFGVLLLLFGLLLVGCSLERNETKDSTNDPKVLDENESEEQPNINEEEEVPPVDEGGEPVGNNGSPPSNNPDQPVSSPEPSNEGKEQQYQNNAFKEVLINEGNKVVISGKARVFEGSFQYAVVSNGEVLKGGTYQTDGAPAWGSFEITVEKEYASKPGVMFELFVYSAKDGSKIDVLEIPLNKAERLNK